MLKAENEKLKAQIESGVVITERVTGAVVSKWEWQARAEAAEAKLERVRDAQRYTITPLTTTTDNPDGEWMRTADVMAALQEQEQDDEG